MSQFPGKEYLKQRVGFQLAQCSSCLRKKRQSKYTIPQSVEDVNTFGTVWFAEFIATESHHDFMITFPNMTGTELDHDEFHDMKLV